MMQGTRMISDKPVRIRNTARLFHELIEWANQE